MAESQYPFPYTASSYVELKKALSDDRFATYLKLAGQDDAYALNLYLYNARLSKAFLFPLHVAEVTLRNSIDRLFSSLYGAQWPRSNAFRTSLNLRSREALINSIDRLEEDKGKNVQAGQIIASLSFDFWSNLFRDEYDRVYWVTHLTKVFPNKPPRFTRADAQTMVKSINQLRNRIAHYEPILEGDSSKAYSEIVLFVSYQSPIVSDWLKHHSTISSAIRTRPLRSGGRGKTVEDMADKSAKTALGDQTLHDLLRDVEPHTPAIIRVDNDKKPTGVITPSEILSYIKSNISDDLSLIDLSSHTVDDVISSQSGSDGWKAIGLTQSLQEAIEYLRVPGSQAVVGTSANGEAMGIIVRSHRRY